jgi:hypothetical protein
MREHLVIKPIASSEVLTPHLNDLLERAVDSDAQEGDTPIEQDALERMHQHLWSEARDKHRERTQALANYRKESLSTSHQKRVTLIQDRIAQATDSRIQLMRQSELVNAEADYQRRIQEFDKAIAKADITAEPVAYGVLEVV